MFLVVNAEPFVSVGDVKLIAGLTVSTIVNLVLVLLALPLTS